MVSKKRSEFTKGIVAEMPILIGVIPFGLIYGVLARSAGITAVEAQAMSVVVFAGSAQFVTTQLVGNGTAGWLIVISIAVINLRHALYSASLAPFLQHLNAKWKSLIAYLLTDEAYAVSISYLGSNNREKNHIHENDSLRLDHETHNRITHWFFLGAGLTMWTTWQISTAIGIILGAVIPEYLALEFALPLTFIALLMPLLEDRQSMIAAISAGCTALVFHELPYRSGLLLAILVGIIVGVWLEARK